LNDKVFRGSYPMGGGQEIAPRPRLERVPASALGHLLRYLRTSKGLTLRALSKRSRISHVYIFHLETGRYRSPSLAVLNKLAEAVGAPAREARMMRYLSEHPSTDPGLVSYALKDETVSYEVFAVVSAACLNHTEPEYRDLVVRVRRLFDEPA
jgi:transcriptional regulator with XRE-family HTH domain